MRPALHRIGEGNYPLVIVDDFSPDFAAVLALADALAPYPRVTDTYYPGVRRMIAKADLDAFAYSQAVCRQVAPLLGAAFGLKGFKFVSASFSIVTAQPHALSPMQRIPHADSTDPKYLAILHYLRLPVPSGTAFYRQRSTGIERVSETNFERFVAAAAREIDSVPEDVGYIQGSNDHFETIASVDAVPNRLIIYQGSVLHSGIVPPDMPLDADPRVGRLTANLFVQGE
jgi:hypothetical protein